MVAILTRTGNGELDTRWMPGADASNFAQTLVGLLLAEIQLLDLGVDEHTKAGAQLLDLVALLLDASALAVLLSIAGESLLLGAHPVLVEATLALLAQVTSPDGRKRLHA